MARDLANDPLIRLLADDPDLAEALWEGDAEAWGHVGRLLLIEHPKHFGGKGPTGPACPHEPGTWQKVETLRKRFARGEPLFREADAPPSERLGFDAESAQNGERFRLGLAVEEEGGAVAHIDEGRPVRQRRRRSARELGQAADPEVRAREAQRKREARRARRGAA